MQNESISRRNLERFLATTGKTEKEYYEWATEVGRRMHINTLDKMVCAKLGLYTVAHLALIPTPLPADIDPERVDEYLYDHSQNPLEIAKLWKQACVDADAWVSVESVLDEHLAPFPKEDFERWGDKNWLPDVSRSWFKKTGRHLDVQVDEINAIAPAQVSIEAILDFVRTYKPNSYQSPAQVIRLNLEDRFRQLTGFRIKDYYVEHLIRSAHFSQPATTETVPF
ncbi:hypothetical protein [Larkinella sp.]|uniref:hypothetical protein n=1 Tax=Larkinella sp. TaxID=2034517 RepID=UPI003BAAE972